MITLKRNSKFVRWCWSVSDQGLKTPSSSSICNLFWRGFVFVPIFWGAVTSIILFFLLCLYLAFLTSLTGFAMLAGAIILSLLFVSYRQKGRIETPTAVVVAIEKGKSIKNKLCPIVRFEND